MKDIKEILSIARTMPSNELGELIDVLVEIYNDNTLKYIEGFDDEKN